MSTHPELELLTAFADGELANDTADVAMHVASCAECTAIVHEQKRVAEWLRREAAAPNGKPMRDRWPQLAEQIGATRRDRTIRAVAVAAAAVLVFAFGVANWRWRSGVVAPEPADVAIDAAADRAAHDLDVAVAANRAQLDSAKRSAIDTALSIIDVSIRQTEHALAADPSDRFLADYLGRLRQKRIAALRDVFDMIRSGP